MRQKKKKERRPLGSERSLGPDGKEASDVAARGCGRLTARGCGRRGGADPAPPPHEGRRPSLQTREVKNEKVRGEEARHLEEGGSF